MLSRVSSSTQHTPRFPQSHVSVWRGDGGEGGRTAHRGEARKDGRMEGVREGGREGRGRESVEPIIFVQNGDCGVVAHSLFPSPSRSISPPFGAAAAAAAAAAAGGNGNPAPYLSLIRSTHHAAHSTPTQPRTSTRLQRGTGNPAALPPSSGWRTAESPNVAARGIYASSCLPRGRERGRERRGR